MLRTGGTLSRKRARTLSDPTKYLDGEEEDAVDGGERVARSTGSGGGSGNSGQHGIPSGESVSPVPRPMPYKHVTFSFVQRSWEEIDTGLSTLPISIALYPILDDEMLTVIKQVLPCCLGFRVHAPHVKLSNFIILTDEIQMKGATPSEMSSFVQQSKIIHYMPKNFVTTGYTLSNVDTIKPITFTKLMGHNKMNQMVKLPNSDDFETLSIYGISGSIHGNLWNRNKMYQGYVLNDLESQHYSLYSSASTVEDTKWEQLSYAYGVVDEKGDAHSATSMWTVEKRAITKCKNLDKIEIVGASDVIEYDIETNIEGDVLYPDTVDNHTPSVFSYFVVKGLEKNSGLTMWKVGCTPWPSTFNPKMYRRNAALGDQWLQAQYKPLQHHFFTMVPIHKSDGKLMKQRASCMVEQSFQVSFIFRDEEIDAMAPLEMCHLRSRGCLRVGVQDYNNAQTTLPFLT